MIFRTELASILLYPNDYRDFVEFKYLHSGHLENLVDINQ